MNGVARGRPVLKTAPLESLNAQGLRVAVVGGTGGLGRAIADALVGRGAHVTVVGRTFRDQGVPNLTFLAADLSRIEEARRVAEALPVEDLDRLILTTGIFSGPVRQASPDGIEIDMAVSYISRFVILREVADRLGINRPKRPRVFVWGFPGTGQKGNPDDLSAVKSYKQFPQHMNTVAANEALVLDTARRYPRLAVFGVNPGLVVTNIRANVLGGSSSLKFKIVESLIGLMTPSPATYARRIVPILLAPELDLESGFHFNKQGVPIHPSESMTTDHVELFIAATERLLAGVRK